VRKPNFFVVGAPRCGTTSLWSWLKAHPEIFMPAEKELFFFDSDLLAGLRRYRGYSGDFWNRTG
jgi:hypothetical protein